MSQDKRSFALKPKSIFTEKYTSNRDISLVLCEVCDRYVIKTNLVKLQNNLQRIKIQYP